MIITLPLLNHAFCLYFLPLIQKGQSYSTIFISKLKIAKKPFFGPWQIRPCMKYGEYEVIINSFDWDQQLYFSVDMQLIHFDLDSMIDTICNAIQQ